LPSVPNLGASMRKFVRRVVLRVSVMSGAKDW